MAAALKAASQGLTVIVAEKEQYFGGTTAISAGWAWVPGNKQGVAQGDTREEAETYLKHLAPETFNEAGVTDFLDTVPEAISFFENETDVKFTYPEKSPDYQMDLPGAKLSGRAILPQDVDARVLGDKRLLMQPYMSSYTVFGYMPQVGPDINEFFHVNQSISSFVYVAKKLLRTWADAARYKRPVLRSNGNALMTRMVKSADDLGVRLWNASPALSLTRDDDGTITGAVIGGEHAATVTARLGVILAAGGFSGNKELRQQYFPHDADGDDHFTPTVGHGGDAATLAISAGGHIDNSVFSVGSWAPVTVFKYLNGTAAALPAPAGDRTAGPDRRRPSRQALRKRGPQLPRLRWCDDRSQQGRGQDVRVCDRRREDDAQIRHRLRQALADAARLLLPDRVPRQGGHPGGTGRQARHRRRGPHGDRG